MSEMRIIEVDEREYKKNISARIVYDSSLFAELNSSKTEEVKYLLFIDKKVRFGLTFGLDKREAKLPFSAPFSMIEPKHSDWRMSQMVNAIENLDQYMMDKGVRRVKWTFPPELYNPSIISSAQNTLYRQGFNIEKIDVNYSFYLPDFDEQKYEDDLVFSNGRKNLRRGLRANLSIHRAKSDEEIHRAYNVIKKNRLAKGFPLKMTLDQVLSTMRIIPHDVFLVFDGEEEIAAAQVFYVTEEVVQVIYWGDVPGFGEKKPINYLAFELLKYYKCAGFTFLDIGPSTENSIPNIGLCEFKQSIGCIANNKLTFVKDY